MSDSALFTVAAVALFAVGVLCGAVLAFFLYSRAFAHVARYQRTGRPDGAPTQPPFTPGGEMRLDPSSLGPSVERGEADAALERIIDRGADALMELEPALTRAGARTKARRALDETGAFSPAGGIPSA